MRITIVGQVLCATAVTLWVGCMGTGGDDSNGAWTTVTPLANASTVTGLWFSSTTNGDVSFAEGFIEHFDTATHIDAIALNGSGAAPGPSDDSYLALLPASAGPIAVNAYAANTLVTSTDMGKSFHYGKLFGSTKVPADVAGEIQLGGVGVGLPLLWLAPDSGGAWHAIDSEDGVWSSPTAPAATATFTLSWHPNGDIPVPNPLPDADCVTGLPANPYFVGTTGQLVWVSPDGMTMLYGNGGDGGPPAGVCRSTDGGKNFAPIEFTPAPIARFPWIVLFTSATVGIAAYASDGDLPGSGYIYATHDGGATWTAATLPASAANTVAFIHAFASPSGTMWIGGGSNGELLLYKSTNGGTTWSDVSAKLASIATSSGTARSRAGFALDDDNIWIGADNGFVAFSATGGE